MAKTKAAAIAVPIPQTREEAEEAMARLGHLQRSLLVIEAAMAERVAGEKKLGEAEAKPLLTEAEALKQGLCLWAEANRAVLTDGGRTKTAHLATGEVSWRARPPRVLIRDLPAVMERLAQLGLHRFVRTKAEPDKQAMLAEPGVAGQVAGITIGSEGEEIILAPTDAPLAGQA